MTNARSLFLPLIVAGSTYCALCISSANSQRQSNADAFLAQCEKRTIVMGRDEKGGVVKSGERLDSYCEGFLMGSFSALTRARVLCQKDSEYPTGDFLLSLVKTYRANSKTEADVAAVIEAAFKRIYYCSQ